MEGSGHAATIRKAHEYVENLRKDRKAALEEDSVEAALKCIEESMSVTEREVIIETLLHGSSADAIEDLAKQMFMLREMVDSAMDSNHIHTHHDDLHLRNIRESVTEKMANQAAEEIDSKDEEHEEINLDALGSTFKRTGDGNDDDDDDSKAKTKEEKDREERLAELRAAQKQRKRVQAKGVKLIGTDTQLRVLRALVKLDKVRGQEPSPTERKRIRLVLEKMTCPNQFLWLCLALMQGCGPKQAMSVQTECMPIISVDQTIRETDFERLHTELAAIAHMSMTLPKVLEEIMYKQTYANAIEIIVGELEQHTEMLQGLQSQMSKTKHKGYSKRVKKMRDKESEVNQKEKDDSYKNADITPKTGKAMIREKHGRTLAPLTRQDRMAFLAVVANAKRKVSLQMFLRKAAAKIEYAAEAVAFLGILLQGKAKLEETAVVENISKLSGQYFQDGITPHERAWAMNTVEACMPDGSSKTLARQEIALAVAKPQLMRTFIAVMGTVSTRGQTSDVLRTAYRASGQKPFQVSNSAVPMVMSFA
eukprot:g5340.t1